MKSIFWEMLPVYLFGFTMVLFIGTILWLIVVSYNNNVQMIALEEKGSVTVKDCRKYAVWKSDELLCLKRLELELLLHEVLRNRTASKVEA